MPLPWTDERNDTARRLYLEGQSASQVARQLGGGVTRNAVIGKLARMGVRRGVIAATMSVVRNLAPRPRPPPTKPRPEPAAHTPLAARQRKLDSMRAATAATPAPSGPLGGKTLLDLRSTDCRYTLDGPIGAEQRFCAGFAPDVLHPWCPTHRAIVYTQAKPAHGDGTDVAPEQRRWA